MNFDSLDLERARRGYEERLAWITAAIAQARYDLAATRARGYARDLVQLIDRYGLAIQQAFESRSTVAKLGGESRKIAADLRATAEKYERENYPPESIARMLAKVAEIEQQAGLFDQDASNYLPLINAYSETLQGLAGIRDEGEDSDDDVFNLRRSVAILGSLLVGIPALQLFGVAGALIGSLAGAVIALRIASSLEGRLA